MKRADYAKRYVDFITSEKRIYQKFFNGLLQIAKREHIPITFFDSVEELNKNYYPETHEKMEDGERAVGIYRWQRLNGFGIMPHESEIGISKCKDERWGDLYTTMILAHELGHHFAIKTKYDRSEETANKYRRYLANRILTPLELSLIETQMIIFAERKTPTYDKERFERDELEPNEVYVDFNEMYTKKRKEKEKLYEKAYNHIIAKYPTKTEMRKRKIKKTIANIVKGVRSFCSKFLALFESTY